MHCKISHEHLTRMFVRSVGVPLRQIIIQLRLERAAYLLRHSTLTVKEIAAQCGYTENHYFSKAFAASFGMTAIAYRKKFADPLVQHVVYDGTANENYPINTYIHLNPLYRS
ncbi:hypothetical protein SD70_02115 [Gordoniibacillus kamchatkensis]|uniref:HTH araC/xylS-type domain-containing protein n=1 Tax=Gordoniibacillus kamchatkensis TaxID=1590651 RepID=A0ABR5AMT9_9BACL|nr:helix-turn-helix transcriptional regulator [Paenibacillus sp. VKM B-2647]KIL42319.1 hypothetical protein SD70_02115 [Paenibacillus sp. VKM B-2647]